MRLPALLVLASVALGVGACAHIREPKVLSDHHGPSPRHIVFVADGAGDYRFASRHLREAALADQLPVEIATYAWSHGYLRNLADQTDYEFARERGRILAERVLVHRNSRRDVRVSLLGHSAGAGVVLAAAECLPPDSIERVVLLAPSVSASYDIRPALRATRVGIDNFYSPADTFWLGTFMCLVGPMDAPLETRAAGRYGFNVRGNGIEDQALYKRLRQYRWGPELRRTGHNGNHFGGYQHGHARRFVLPLFVE